MRESNPYRSPDAVWRESPEAADELADRYDGLLAQSVVCSLLWLWGAGSVGGALLALQAAALRRRWEHPPPWGGLLMCLAFSGAGLALAVVRFTLLR